MTELILSMVGHLSGFFPLSLWCQSEDFKPRFNIGRSYTAREAPTPPRDHILIQIVLIAIGRFTRLFPDDSLLPEFSEPPVLGELLKGRLQTDRTINIFL